LDLCHLGVKRLALLHKYPHFVLCTIVESINNNNNNNNFRVT
jgi:hypothetical protein